MNNKKYGQLYICPGPIGNLSDITLRVLETLKSVSVVASEDTRLTRKLLSNYKIKANLVSYYDKGFASFKEEYIIRLLKEGNDVALISGAGMPLVCDPGYNLIRRCYEENIQVVALPGPTAFIVAVVVSGLRPYPFLFMGFLPSKSTLRKKLLEKLCCLPYTLVFYEVPHRLLRSLRNMRDILGDRKICLARELTKVYEEIIRGDITQMIAHFEEQKPRGEFTIVLEGAREEEVLPVAGDVIKAEIEALCQEGMALKEAMRKVAQKRKMARREIYRIYHDSK